MTERVTYYVSALAREYYYNTASEYNYTREPRRITATRTIPNLPAPRPSTWGLANLITALSTLNYTDTRDPDIIATDDTRAHYNPPRPPAWYDRTVKRWQWRLALPTATRNNLLTLADQYNIQPFSQRYVVINDNTRISVTLEAIGQGNLTPVDTIPTCEYATPLRYTSDYPTVGGKPSLTSSYYLRGY